MATVVSLVGSFLVGRRLAGQPGVDVPGVPSTGSTLAITGGPISGDGHLCYFTPGSPFGVVTIKTSFAQTKTVVGIGSAQAFGIVTRITGGVISSSSGVPSAQAFGTISFKTTVRTTLVGLGSAQAFGVLTTAYVQHITGLGSAQAFGAVTTRSGFTKQVGAVPSAQAFGVPHPTWPQAFPLPGVDSAQRFGTPTIAGSIKPQAGGVPSAQAFGVVFPVYRQPAPVQGLGSAQDFGDPETGFAVFNVWLHDLHCLGSPDEPICGYPICGDGNVCGGYGFLIESDCITSTDPAVLNEFLAGQQLVGGYPDFLEELDCLVSPGVPICDNPTICGTFELVCGGLSFNSELDCLLWPDPTVLDEFLVGQKLVGGEGGYNAPAPEPLIFDLQPVGCL